MNSRPILFNATMVRALLDGSKTQTRRVVKGKALDTIDFMSNSVDEQDGSTADLGQGWLEGLLKVWSADYPEEGSESIQCPYGKPGDQLWVREAWDFLPDGVLADGTVASQPNQAVIRYWADTSLEFRAVPLDFNPMIYNREKVRPSIHMPRWASRITLQITGVRVERLNSITETDAIAEGIQRGRDGMWNGALHAVKGTPRAFHTAIGAYDDLWTHINGPESWAQNPWVWVVGFKVIKT